MSDQQQHPDPAIAPTLTRLIPDLDDELVATPQRRSYRACSDPTAASSRCVEVALHDLALLAAVAAQLGHALALAPGADLADAIEAGAEAAYRARSPGPSTGVELVESFARINGLLDLATTADTEMLTRRLWADGCSDLVITIDEEIAYTRTAHRLPRGQDPDAARSERPVERLAGHCIGVRRSRGRTHRRHLWQSTMPRQGSDRREAS